MKVEIVPKKNEAYISELSKAIHHIKQAMDEITVLEYEDINTGEEINADLKADLSELVSQLETLQEEVTCIPDKTYKKQPTCHKGSFRRTVRF